jgi:chromosome segregation ATPase
MLIQSNAEPTKCRHADAAKLKSTLEGVEKGHAIAMEELNQQLRKSLAENATLERQLKDRENQGKKKDKEIADLRKATADFEKRREGFNEILHHFQDNLLGTTSYIVKFLISAMQFVTRLLFSAMQLPWGKARWTPLRACAWPPT